VNRRTPALYSNVRQCQSMGSSGIHYNVAGNYQVTSNPVIRLPKPSESRGRVTQRHSSVNVLTADRRDTLRYRKQSTREPIDKKIGRVQAMRGFA